MEKLVNIKIQVSNKVNMYNRSEFYALRLMSHSVLKGKQYEDIPEIILINILDYKMFKDKIGYRYFPKNGVAFYKGKFYRSENGKLYDKEMNVFKDKKNNEIIMDTNKFNSKLTTIHFIELPKFKIKNKNNKNNNNDENVNNDGNNVYDVSNDDHNERDDDYDYDDANDANEDSDDDCYYDENNDDGYDINVENDNDNDDDDDDDDEISDEDINLWIKFLNNPND